MQLAMRSAIKTWCLEHGTRRKQRAIQLAQSALVVHPAEVLCSNFNNELTVKAVNGNRHTASVHVHGRVGALKFQDMSL